MTKDSDSESHTKSHTRFPDYGPCEVGDWSEFLLKSREEFYNCWDHQNEISHKETLDDLEQVTLLGNGSFGDVILVKHKESGTYYAMKAIEKEKIIKHKQLEHMKSEKKILKCIDFPLIVYLVYFFKDNGFIYMVMPFIVGGELFTHLRKCERFTEDRARFYASQVILAMEYLHHLDLVYRDLKPENILVDHTGYLKVADFGFCKRLTKNRTYTLCGTPEYLAPEVILGKGYGKAVDWWAIGVLMYEMVAGFTPYCASNDIKVYDRIVNNKYKMPSFFSEHLADLVRNILQLDTTRRFGNLKSGVDDIKNHNWFKTTNWMAVVNRKMTPPWKPKESSPGDIIHFTKTDWKPPAIPKVDMYTKEFADF